MRGSVIQTIQEGLSAWKADRAKGQLRPLTSYLPARASAADWTEIIKLDLQEHWNSGTAKDLADYCKNYPEIGPPDSLPSDLVQFAYRLECKYGNPPDPVGFFRRYGKESTSIAAADDQTQAGGGLSTAAPDAMEPGQVIGDFEIIRVLGSGSFGSVYLARQISLERQVALKVTPDAGTEALTLAQLEHENIVQVYSESIDLKSKLRLLCIQFVQGPTLEQIIEQCRAAGGYRIDGELFLATVDKYCSEPILLRPAALRERGKLEKANRIELIAHLGERLADALAFAHSQGVCHRDVKPANILVNPYGSPLLADFNISTGPTEIQTTDTFGGSLAYMAPEHLAAFASGDPDQEAAVDGRSDVYSLGLVLAECLTGRSPTEGIDPQLGGWDRVHAIEQLRRAPLPGWWTEEFENDRQPRAVNYALRGCLDPDPDRRFQSATGFAEALSAATEHHHAEKQLPSLRGVLTALLRWPFLCLLALILIPHVAASLVNILYNGFRVMNVLSDQQNEAFYSIVMVYNAIVYPICVALLTFRLLPLKKTWDSLGRAPGVEAVQAARQRLLKVPALVVGVSCLGWLPGGILFPLGIWVLTGELDLQVAGHFLVSFTISGLIALTYSYFAAQFVVLRVLYPRFCLGQRIRDFAREELANARSASQFFQIISGMIPLAAAIILLMSGPSELEQAEYVHFRYLVLTLIMLGLLGYIYSIQVSRILMRVIGVYCHERID